MNRRDWLKTAGALGAAATLPLESLALPETSSSAKIETDIKRLNLRHTWTTTMSSSAYRDVIMVRYIRDASPGTAKALRSFAIRKTPSLPRRRWRH